MLSAKSNDKMNLVRVDYFLLCSSSESKHTYPLQHYRSKRGEFIQLQMLSLIYEPLDGYKAAVFNEANGTQLYLSHQPHTG